DDKGKWMFEAMPIEEKLIVNMNKVETTLPIIEINKDEKPVPIIEISKDEQPTPIIKINKVKSSKSIIERLEKLKDLYLKGYITLDEYNEKKKDILKDL